MPRRPRATGFRPGLNGAAPPAAIGANGNTDEQPKGRTNLDQLVHLPTDGGDGHAKNSDQNFRHEKDRTQRLNQQNG
ncbi:MAG: hypothetical protein AAF727_04450 [Pseudomonadota bacterium]